MRARTALNAKMMALRAAALAYLRAEGVAAAHGVRAQCSPGAVRGGVIATASRVESLYDATGPRLRV